MVGHDLSCCLVCLRVSVGVAETGVNQSELDASENERCDMFDDKNNARWPTLVAGLILLIVLAAVAAMPVELGTDECAGSAVARLTTGRRVSPTIIGQMAAAAQGTAGERLLASLAPIGETISGAFPDDALVSYDIGIAPDAAFELIETLIEAALPDLHTWLENVFDEFQMATGLDPEIDLLPYLDHGLAVGLLPSEIDVDGWPFPRKVVILRVLDDVAVSRFLEAWISWEAGAIAPKTQGVLGASVISEEVAGSKIVGLQLDGLLPAGLPLPSPSYALAGDYLIVSSVRSAVAESLGRLENGISPVPEALGEETVVEVVKLNFPEWPLAWQRAEPFVGSLIDRLGGDSPTFIRFCRTMIEYLGEFQPAHGTTSLIPGGGFVFRIEVTPLR